MDRWLSYEYLVFRKGGCLSQHSTVIKLTGYQGTHQQVNISSMMYFFLCMVLCYGLRERTERQRVNNTNQFHKCKTKLSESMTLKSLPKRMYSKFDWSWHSHQSCSLATWQIIQLAARQTVDYTCHINATYLFISILAAGQLSCSS